MSERIYPVPLKPKSGITCWSGWPDDVVETLRKWNRQGKLSFRGSQVFKCIDCALFCEPQSFTAAMLRYKTHGKWHKLGNVCDDCLIARARKKP